MVVVPLYNELLYVFSASVPKAENIAYEALESERPIRAFAENLFQSLPEKYWQRQPSF